MNEEEYYDSVQEAIFQQYNEKLQDMHAFLCAQIDKFLRDRTADFQVAILLNDPSRLEIIRQDAHKMIDAAIAYKARELDS